MLNLKHRLEPKKGDRIYLLGKHGIVKGKIRRFRPELAHVEIEIKRHNYLVPFNSRKFYAAGYRNQDLYLTVKYKKLIVIAVFCEQLRLKIKKVLIFLSSVFYFF